MAGWRRFEEIEAWQASRKLNSAIWGKISSGNFGKDFALCDQINRAAGSIMDNIAEGFDGGSDAEFARFLRYSQRSCSEVKSQLYRSLDRAHIDAATFNELVDLLEEIHAKTGSLISYLSK